MSCQSPISTSDNHNMDSTIITIPRDLPTSSRHSSIAFSSIEAKLNDNNYSTSSSCTMADVRDEIFHLGAIVGRLCTVFLPEHSNQQQRRQQQGKDCALAVEKEHRRPTASTSSRRQFWENDEHCSAPSSSSSEQTKAAHYQLGQVFLQIFVVAGVCGIDLPTSILKKMELNGRKYPVELCKGKSGKYTNYSEHTGITTTEGQSTIDSPIKVISSSSATTNGSGGETITQDTTSSTIEGMTSLIQNFANERQWNHYHTPRNIALALLGEVGELAELFQWSGDVGLVRDVLSEETLDKAGQEIADVSIYLLRLCDVCHVPLGEVAMELLESRRNYIDESTIE